MRKTGIFTIFFIYTSLSFGFEPDWSSDAILPGEQNCFDSHGHLVCLRNGNRSNIYQQTPQELSESVLRGSEHVLNYPVDVTELRLPKKAMDKFFNSESTSLIRRFIFSIAKKISNFKSYKDLFHWMGLHDYPTKESEVGPNIIADMGELEKYPMGVSIFDQHSKNPSISFSCAACHGQNLFGVRVLGLSNRFPKANEIFILGKKALSKSNTLMFRMFLNPSREDINTYKISKEAMRHVRLKKPITLGLDTSLAQVGLSLATRNKDEYATKMKRPRPRPSQLDKDPADSKPAVWWNLKYKTKWLSDGSIVSGNPVHTNFLWNEIGRGVDLLKLENWLTDNKHIVKDLTAYAFNTKAPRFNEFFPNRINLEKARRGEKLFLKSCKGCHGIYDKAWNTNKQLTYEEKLATTEVWYHEKTPVIDIDTDPYRKNGMKYFAEDLNRLKISKTMGTVVKPQKGYVPPPLVGIWARWPYFHNNSAPSLYAVLTPSAMRPKSYIAVPSIDKVLDFDMEKNGYPAPRYIQNKYKKRPELKYNTLKKGMSNSGHTVMLLNQDGGPKFNHKEKLELIEFLRTL